MVDFSVLTNAIQTIASFIADGYYAVSTAFLAIVATFEGLNPLL